MICTYVNAYIISSVITVSCRYVPWNAHEPEQESYRFEGQNDLVGFLKTAHDIGLLAIVRAGPYMCGEWEFVSDTIFSLLLSLKEAMS